MAATAERLVATWNELAGTQNAFLRRMIAPFGGSCLWFVTHVCYDTERGFELASKVASPVASPAIRTQLHFQMLGRILPNKLTIRNG